MLNLGDEFFCVIVIVGMQVFIRSFTLLLKMNQLVSTERSEKPVENELANSASLLFISVQLPLT